MQAIIRLVNLYLYLKCAKLRKRPVRLSETIRNHKREEALILAIGGIPTEPTVSTLLRECIVIVIVQLMS